MIEIRRATVADAIHIALLGRITYTESHGDYVENKKDLLDFYDKHYAVSNIRKELNDAENLFWIVFSDELPIGFAKLCLNEDLSNLKDNNFCKLQRLYILNDFIGDIDIAEVIEELKEIVPNKFLEGVESIIFSEYPATGRSIEGTTIYIKNVAHILDTNQPPLVV